MNILEIRKKIEDINNKYDAEIAELQIKISAIEEKKQQELGDLPAQYDAKCSEIIENSINGTLAPIKGVSIRTLKSVKIYDDSLIPDSYRKFVIDDKKIKADMKEPGYTKEIPGVRVITNYSVAVRLK